MTSIPVGLSDNPCLWTVEEVGEWLRETGLGQHVSQFRSGAVDGLALFYLSEQHLDRLGLPPGAAIRFLLARGYLARRLKPRNPLGDADDPHSTPGITWMGMSAHDIAHARAARAKLQSAAYLVGHQAVAAHNVHEPAAHGNMPSWQKRQFDKICKVLAAIVIGIELLLNMLPKVHPAAHLIALLPGAVAGQATYLRYIGL